ncbi:MAG TPA: prolyl oligopeptidase family serine peptidase [Tepidisphaeraceae bacterium]|nr:prolyl oligopeptidase family serine peptidase [Tepidisphaeraceae bacterium]
MKSIRFIAAIVVTAALAGAATVTPPPPAPVHPVTDDYYGNVIVDPYRYMENLDDPAVQKWIKAEADYAKQTLDSLRHRDELFNDITKYTDAAPALVDSVERLPGEKYFFLKTLAHESIAKLYFRQGLGGKDVLIVDTDKFKGPHGEPAAINEFEPSEDGKYVACSISQGGAEIGAIHVFDVATGKETGDVIDRVWGADVCWRPDNVSFFYHRLNKIPPGGSEEDLELNSKIYLHVLGDHRDDDMEILGNGLSDRTSIDPIDWPAVEVQPGTDYAIGLISRGVQIENRLYAAPAASLTEPNIPWQMVADFGDDVTNFALHGNDIYVLTHKDAQRFKILRTNLAHPDLAHADVVMPEQAGILTDLSSAADGLYVVEMQNGLRSVIRMPWGGRPTPLTLPVVGNASVSADSLVSGVVLELGSWTRADQYFLYDPGTNAVLPTDLQPAGPYDHPDYITSMEVQAPSYDGTMIPLSIIMKKGLKQDGTNPTELIGYGAYGISLDPGFDPAALAWLDRGGILAIAHVRGGGENGEAWHEAGEKLTKPNTWRDLIACGEYLVNNKWTDAGHLAAVGGSAGGITVGRAVTERPDLFAAASIRAGAVNTLRMEFSPNGPPNIPEFGSVKTQFGFEDLYAMDAYQHVRKGVAYPAMLFAIGMNDPRVPPWMSAKMVAKMQADTSSGRPVLLRVDYESGHGIGSTKTQYNKLIADTWAFFMWQFGEPGYGPASK